MNKANKIYATMQIQCSTGYTKKLAGISVYLKQTTVLWDFQKRTLLVNFQRVKYKNGATKCLGGIAFQWKSWRREYNSVILVKNSYDESWDSSCEKY